MVERKIPILNMPVRFWLDAPIYIINPMKELMMKVEISPYTGDAYLTSSVDDITQNLSAVKQAVDDVSNSTLKKYDQVLSIISHLSTEVSAQKQEIITLNNELEEFKSFSEDTYIRKFDDPQCELCIDDNHHIELPCRLNWFRRLIIRIFTGFKIVNFK